MNPDILFKIVNAVVFLAWILMIAAPKWKVTKAVISSHSIVLFLAVIYAAILFTNFNKVDFADFGSLAGIMKIFHSSDAWGTSAVWYHIMAFDLFVGSWIFRDSQKLNVPHWVIIPCLLLTFMLGPLGFILYSISKFLCSKFFRKQQNT